MPSRTHVVFGAERVVVEHGLPVGVGSEVIGQRGLAQDAADVAGVLPEVEDFVAVEVGHGKPMRVFGDLERLGLVRRKARVAVEHSGAAGVFGLHPGHRAGAVDAFEPCVLVGVGREGLRAEKRYGRKSKTDCGDEGRGSHGWLRGGVSCLVLFYLVAACETPHLGNRNVGWLPGSLTTGRSCRG
jgi:hypothetical protein